ncbi:MULTISPECIES: low molecular weight phosphatase family protein [Elizabethkingia]|uniref:Protein-tyrosine-phosphatase n=1 Tax=Elizabethkingia meningoseptica TaxID=238 RepID=A0A1T3FL58_ELIME|nr:MULTISPECIES: protein-tyrosine-phosphatase [Elizabethkingia]AQX13338.1 protein-tyrosine-phosphatase [Elizabethkingia meningoseptica]MBG0514970.1 protein-tyrosine-phosphatase [Elizabethkingia meningoseptica]MDE5434531.1 protein-tyrosine-phosphatase [Elizabethkingia meningoseptica]MDE5481410.1 protein-tyrosine-phosphatase [Elizabethkingia meningoseptica]MDE5537133.1 protein-tyrosine-phosphatase [Elizabethkingia meningoseptica]
MYEKLWATIQKLNWKELDSGERKKTLQALVDFIQQKVDGKQKINLNFICTHNSRRSHLSQIWAQVASEYFNIRNVNCYSGGMEETAVFPKVIETLSNQGFRVFKIADGVNPVYAVKYGENALPVIGFSKRYDSEFNPLSEFVAIMTCSQADGGCPFIAGAEKRIPITFEDPKVSDNTREQTQVYLERSIEIATEMFYVFSQIKV